MASETSEIIVANLSHADRRIEKLKKELNELKKKDQHFCDRVSIHAMSYHEGSKGTLKQKINRERRCRRRGWHLGETICFIFN